MTAWRNGNCRIFLLCLCSLTISGCDRTSEVAAKSSRPGKLVAADSAQADKAALQLLERCASAYGRLIRYQDAARVVLSYKVEGVATHDTAPLAIAYESPNRIGIKAYQVEAGPDGQRFRMRIGQPRNNDHPADNQHPLLKQVVSRALPDRIDMAWLLTDTVAVQHLAAGLAGSPPQLELLLGKAPFRALLDGATQVALDGQGTETGELFHIVRIARGSASYRLWIHATTLLLRRIELPTQSLPEQMLADPRISHIRLSVEFDQAQADPHIDWSQWKVKVEPLDPLVRYFVTPAGIEMDQRMGKKAPAFRLPTIEPHDQSPNITATQSTSNSHEFNSSSAAANGQVQILLWLADHPTCRVTLSQIQQALNRLPDSTRSRIRATAIWAEGQPAAGTSFGTLADEWDMTLPLVWDADAVGRDLFGIDEAPAIVILDSQHRVQFFQERGNPLLAEALPEMLTRLGAGENLVETMLARNHSEQLRFAAQLWMARASDATAGAFTQPATYVPEHWKLESIESRNSQPEVLALTADDAGHLWILTADGQIQCRRSDGQPEVTLQCNWDLTGSIDSSAKPSPSTTRRLVVDSRGKLLALASGQANAIQLLDIESKKATSIDLSGQRWNDVRWLPTQTGPRLAVVTDSGRTLLIDPARSQQHSGRSPVSPIAVVPRQHDDALASGQVVLSDGKVEPIIVDDEGGVRRAALAQPVSSPSSSDLPTTNAIARDSSATSTKRQLNFIPSVGPWCPASNDPQSPVILACGMLAADEPALFVLDHQLQPVLHTPLPLGGDPRGIMVCVANHGQSGLPVWVLGEESGTLHFLRADGQLIDHCQMDQPIRGLAILPEGADLQLWLAHAHSIERYRLSLRQR